MSREALRSTAPTAPLLHHLHCTIASCGLHRHTNHWYRCDALLKPARRLDMPQQVNGVSTISRVPACLLAHSASLCMRTICRCKCIQVDSYHAQQTKARLRPAAARDEARFATSTSAFMRLRGKQMPRRRLPRRGTRDQSLTCPSGTHVVHHSSAYSHDPPHSSMFSIPSPRIARIIISTAFPPLPERRTCRQVSLVRFVGPLRPLGSIGWG